MKQVVKIRGVVLNDKKQQVGKLPTIAIEYDKPTSLKEALANKQFAYLGGEAGICELANRDYATNLGNKLRALAKAKFLSGITDEAKLTALVKEAAATELATPYVPGQRTGGVSRLVKAETWAKGLFESGQNKGVFQKYVQDKFLGGKSAEAEAWLIAEAEKAGV